MIRINLLGDDTVIDHTGKIVALSFLASIAVLIVGCVLLYSWSSDKLSGLQAESKRLETRLAELRETTKEVRDLEAKKTEIASKLEVMAKLKRAKPGPVRVLDDLNLAIPDRAWLSQFKEKGGNLLITGTALDNETIATFMQNLERSAYFKTVDLGETVQTNRHGVKVKTFSLKSMISYAGFLTSALEKSALKKAETGEGKKKAEKS
jgi:type IV pilus assembly protein PilN